MAKKMAKRKKSQQQRPHEKKASCNLFNCLKSLHKRCSLTDSTKWEGFECNIVKSYARCEEKLSKFPNMMETLPNFLSPKENCLQNVFAIHINVVFFFYY